MDDPEKWSLQIAGMAIGSGSWDMGGINFVANPDCFGPDSTFRLEWTLLTKAKAVGSKPKGSVLLHVSKKAKAGPKQPDTLPPGRLVAAASLTASNSSATAPADQASLGKKVSSNLKTEGISLFRFV